MIPHGLVSGDQVTGIKRWPLDLELTLEIASFLKRRNLFRSVSLFDGVNWGSEGDSTNPVVLEFVFPEYSAESTAHPLFLLGTLVPFVPAVSGKWRLSGRLRILRPDHSVLAQVASGRHGDKWSASFLGLASSPPTSLSFEKRTRIVHELLTEGLWKLSREAQSEF